MTRKEEIEQAAKKAYPYEGGTKGMICEGSIPIFIQGAEWADLHPSFSWQKDRYEEWMDRVCDWLENNIWNYTKTPKTLKEVDVIKMLQDLNKEMEAMK